MPVVLAFHIIFVIAWFAGLFYLPRLFVYHAPATDQISLARFKIMERRLYYGIMMPASLLATGFGAWYLSEQAAYYLTQSWMILKLLAVVALWGYHLYCGHLVLCFKEDRNTHSANFYRFFNEIPTVLLMAIVLLVVIKPHF